MMRQRNHGAGGGEAGAVCVARRYGAGGRGGRCMCWRRAMVLVKERRALSCAAL